MRAGTWRGGPLGPSQIAALWTQAGGPASAVGVMTQIVPLESGGYPDAYNPTDNGGTQTSWGLWQVSDGTHNAPAGWDDPMTNARMAVAKYNGALRAGRNPFSPWGTYNPSMENGSAPQTGGVAPGANTSVFSQVTQSSSNVFALFDTWVRNNNVNVLYKAFVLCFVLLVLAAIPKTSKFAYWFALAILLVLLIQQEPTPNQISQKATSNTVGGNTVTATYGG